MWPLAVILKGKGASSRNIPSYKRQLANTYYEVWTLNDDPTEDTVRHFEVHSGGGHHLPLVDSKWAELRHAKCLYIAPSMPITRPYQVHYPLEDIKQMVGEATFCLTNTFSYMIALAAYERIPNIFIAGCDFNSGMDQRMNQRPDVERWIYFAEGRGCRVTWDTRESSLCSFRGTIYQ